MQKSISIGEAIKFSWKAFKKNALVLMLLTLMVFVIQILLVIPSCGDETVTENIPATAGASCTLWALAQYAVNVFISLGYTSIAIVAAEENKIQFIDFFKHFGKFFHFLLAWIFFSIIFFVGLILLFFPGIIWGLRYSLYPFMVVGKGAFGWTALKLSSQATYGAKWDLLGLFAVILLLMLAGVLTFGLGLFITIPLTWIAQAYAWKKLTEVGG